MRFRYATLAGVLALSGCALEPNNARVEFEHTSHVTQHEPFTSETTRYGINSVAVIAHWRVAAGAYMELGEGVSLDRCANGYCGSFRGPREQFIGRAGYVVNFKP